jgi:hypothetical protein
MGQQILIHPVKGARRFPLQNKGASIRWGGNEFRRCLMCTRDGRKRKPNYLATRDRCQPTENGEQGASPRDEDERNRHIATYLLRIGMKFDIC